MSDRYKLDGTETPLPVDFDHHEQIVRENANLGSGLEYPKVVGYYKSGEPIVAQNAAEEALLGGSK